MKHSDNNNKKERCVEGREEDREKERRNKENKNKAQMSNTHSAELSTASATT